MSVAQVIRVHGTAKIAHLDGERIDRRDLIFVRSEGGWFYTIDTDNHFVYRQTKKFGSSLMCTCGSVAGVFNYEAYARYTSTNRGRIVACVNHMQTGKHGDGST